MKNTSWTNYILVLNRSWCIKVILIQLKGGMDVYTITNVVPIHPVVTIEEMSDDYNQSHENLSSRNYKYNAHIFIAFQAFTKHWKEKERTFREYIAKSVQSQMSSLQPE